MIGMVSEDVGAAVGAAPGARVVGADVGFDVGARVVGAAVGIDAGDGVVGAAVGATVDVQIDGGFFQGSTLL
jgi:hypothetical protein